MTVYYNENDPKAAVWLRELIFNELIPEGYVDERSIAEVKAKDLDGFSQHHFFAGIGGWSYALRLSGWPDDRPVWTGSCPCQPFSVAGKRRGTADERHLWPATGDVRGLADAASEQEGRTGQPREDGFWSAADWLQCTDGKARRVEPGTFPLAHGVPARVGRLRGYGNAIVPQVAAEFIIASGLLDV